MEKTEPKIKPIQRIHTVLRGLLISLTGLTVLLLMANVFVYLAYAQMPPETSYDGVFVTAEFAVALIAILQLFALAATFISFGVWIYRMNYNLRLQSSYPMEITPGWAVGWYFIPVANFFKPYQAMREIYIASHRDEPVSHTILRWWWGLWIVSIMADNIAIGAGLEPVTVQDAMNGMILTGVAEALGIVLNIVALFLVTKIWQAYAIHFGDTDYLNDDSAIHPSVFG